MMGIGTKGKLVFLQEQMENTENAKQLKKLK